MAKIATLIDDFQDGVINPSLWSADPGVTESGGRLRITPSTSYPICGTVLPRTHDLTLSSIVAHVPVVTSNGSTGTLQCGMVVDKDSNNHIGIRKVGNTLVCSKLVAGTESILATALYDTVNHLFWRIRVDSSNVYWETSSTGTGYFIQHTINTSTLGFAIDVVGAYFFAGYTGVEAFPGTFQIEAVNPGLPLTATGASTSSGSLALSITSPLDLTASGQSTSSGSFDFTIVPAAAKYLTASGASTSSGQLNLVILESGALTFSGASTSTGSLTLSVYVLTLPEDFYYFEPPVVYDNPPTLPEPTRPRYINAHAKWKGGQARGRSLLKYTGGLVYPDLDLFPDPNNLFPLIEGQVTYVLVDTPTVDQMAAAEFTYQGGHVYVVANDEAENLVNAGFTIGAPV